MNRSLYIKNCLVEVLRLTIYSTISFISVFFIVLPAMVAVSVITSSETQIFVNILAVIVGISMALVLNIDKILDYLFLPAQEENLNRLKYSLKNFLYLLFVINLAALSLGSICYLISQYNINFSIYLSVVLPFIIGYVYYTYY